MANEVLIPVKYVVDDSGLQKAGAKIGALTAEEKKLEAEMNDVANAARRQATEFNRAGDAGVKAAKNVEGQYNVLGNTIGSLGGIIAGVFAVDRLLSFGKAVLDTTAEFQRLKAVLTSSLGSESAAQRAFDRIAAFAAKTPYGIQEITDSFVRLAGRGIQPANAQLTAMGDVAAAVGKDMGQLTEAILDVNNTERWTELGVKVRTEGDKIIGTFRGMTVEAERTEAGALKMVQAFGEMEGVAGTMEKVSATLGGQISNLNDNFDQLLVTLGSKGEGVFLSTISLLSKLTEGFTYLISDDAQKSAERYMAALSYFTDGTEGFTTLEQINGQIEEINLSQQRFIASQAEVGRQIAELRGEIGMLDEATHLLTGGQSGNIAKLKELEEEYNTYEMHINASVEAVDALKKKTEELTNAQGGTKNELGRIEELRLKIKEITKERDTQVGLTQKEANQFNQRIATLQRELDLLTKISNEKRKATDPVKYAQEINFIKELTEAEKDSFEERDKAAEKYRDNQMRRINDEIEAEKERLAAIRQLAEERARIEEDIQWQIAGIGIMAADMFIQSEQDKYARQRELIQERYDHEIAMAGDNATARKALEEKEREELAKITNKEAKLKQKAAIFEILVNAAEKAFAIKAQAAVLASNPLTVGLVPMALGQLPVLAASTILQTGFVLSQKLPGYLKGTRKVPGTYKGKDEVLAMLAPEERVITAEKNRAFSPAFDVLTDTKRSPQFWNKVLPEIEKLGILAPNVKDLPPVVSSNTELISELREQNRILKNLPIHQAFIDEKGFTKKVVTSGATIIKMNKRYDY